MTSAQRMLTGVMALIGLAAAGPVGCASDGSRLVAPTRLTSPYDTSRGDVVWAVVPPRNESGSTDPDTTSVGDAFVAAASGVEGITVLPINRTLRAMRALGLEAITSPAEAQQLTAVLGADAVLVSTLTAWDPYDPPVVGLNASLFPAPGRSGMMPGGRIEDTRLFQLRATEEGESTIFTNQADPTAVVSKQFDARDHETVMALQRYAEGRTEYDDPLGWRVHLKSSSLYTGFAAHQTVALLLEREWLRLARQANAASR